MRTSAIIVAGLFAAASAGVVRQGRQTVPDIGGPVNPDADRTCTKSGEKCAGVPGEAEVVFASCCDERLTCGVPTELPEGEWGQFCILDEQVDVEATAVANGETVADDEDATTAPTTTGADGEDAEDADADDEDADGTTGGIVTPGSSSDDAEDDAAESTAEDDDTTTTAGGITSADDEDPDASFDEDGNEVDPVTGARLPGATDEEDDDDDGSVCFPGSATVELENGAVVRMDALSVGDMVKVGVNEFSRVFMFTHKMAAEAHSFVSLKTASGAALELTAGHYIYANGALVAAKTVSVGDVLTLGNGETSSVVAVENVAGTGLFNPQTVNGNVVVNGVVSSTYTTAVEPTFAHSILAPFRMLSNFGFSFTALESGGGVLADVAPRGQATF